MQYPLNFQLCCLIYSSFINTAYLFSLKLKFKPLFCIILWKSHLTKLVASEVTGFSGGIWFLRNDTMLDIEVLSMHDQILLLLSSRVIC